LIWVKRPPQDGARGLAHLRQKTALFTRCGIAAAPHMKKENSDTRRPHGHSFHREAQPAAASMEGAMTHRVPILKIWLILLLAALGVMLMPGVATPQSPTGPPCANRAEVVANLHRLFGERLIGSGLSYTGEMVEIFTGPSGGWTIIATDATGRSCLLATGEAWESERMPPVEADAAI
jgi:hypothetical protein